MNKPVMTGTKTCIHCKAEKPVTEFYPHKGQSDGRLNTCRICKIRQADEWRRANPERFNETRYRRELVRKYGVTVEHYDALVAASDGRCPGCQRVIRLVLDHDHGTGEARGLVCVDCNLALGRARDSAATLRALADYLDAHARWAVPTPNEEE